jgi:lariat debranching enzyme
MAGLQIAVEGCAHGELQNIYSAIEEVQSRHGMKIDVLLICGDFQAIRNEQDLNCMAVPQKYRTMSSFYKYYSGELVAPVLTIFVGGNHEASNHLWELYHGGWVAPNIYFLGYGGVVTVKGIKIGGLSGIFKSGDYSQGHWEHPPYDDGSMRSAYHIREYQVRGRCLRGEGAVSFP